jgi:hypothetical protein
VSFTLEARLPSAIAGTVHDLHGTPLAGAEVLLLQKDLGQRLTTVTDSTGSYSLPVNQGDYTGGYWLSATVSGYAVGFADLVIPNGANLREDFFLPKLGSLTGLITDTGQTPPEPVAGASVQASISTNDPLIPGTVAATSDAAGRYQLQVPPGPTGITVRATGFETYTATVTVMADGTVNQDVGLVRASATLACTVAAASSGNLIADAYVSVIGGLPGPLTHDGSYTVVRIPAGQQVVNVRAEGYKPQQSSLEFAAGQKLSVSFYLDSALPGPPPNPHPPT